MTDGWGLVDAIDAVTEAVADREMIVWGHLRRSYVEVAQRSSGLAEYLAGRGLGTHRERSELQRWECGQSPIALVMANRPEYIESMYAAFRARAVPVNVNQHYKPAEVASLFAMVGVEAVIYERRFGELIGPAIEGTGAVLIDIDDGSGADRLSSAVDYTSAVETAGAPLVARSQPDDIYMVCTGGTTGTPKGVLWRQADIFCAAMGGRENTSAQDMAAAAGSNQSRWFAAPPLMHAAAQWTAFSGIHSGGTVVLHDDSARFDASTILQVAESERVTLISLVGDAYARPIIEDLRRRSYDLSALSTIAIGGAFTSEANKQALLELIPSAMVLDGYGASETGGMAFGPQTKQATPRGFAPAAGAVVLSSDRSRVLAVGDDELGWVARRGRVPLGYLGNQTATEQTFPIVDGETYAVPGDRARLFDDGAISLLGRDAMVVNTGGEKVFVEEVEEVLRGHDAVADALVVGRPSDRFGQEVVGVVQLRPGVSSVPPSELREHCAAVLARFKAPRAIAFVDLIGRHRSGKPDYRWALEAALDATDATGES